MSEAAPAKRRPRWHLLFYLLAVLNLLAVLLGLYVTHRLTVLFDRVVVINESWTEHSKRIAELRSLVGSAGGRARNAFFTSDPAAEEKALAATATKFRERLEETQQALLRETDGATRDQFRRDFAAAGAGMERMAARGREILAQFSSDHAAAAASMPLMDDEFGGLIATLSRLGDFARQTETALFAEQSRVEDAAERWRYLMGALVLALVGGTMVYGRKMSAQFDRDTRANELAAAALAESDERLRALLRSIDEIVFEFDATGTYLNVWTSDERLLARPRAELLGQRIADILGDERAAPFLQLIGHVIATGRAENMVYELQVQSGLEWFLARVSPILSPDGSCHSVCMLSREITLQKKTEQELRVAKAEAEQANSAKSEFLSRMSHELRTPMNAILGFGQLLEQEENLTAEQRESIEQILRGGRHLLELINEVLDISRIESGKMAFESVPVPAEQLIDDTLHLMQPLAADSGVTLRKMPVHQDCAVLADPQRLRQVLLNLVGNAIKYNRRAGEVAVGCASVPGDKLRISISDTGPGIAPEDQPRVFAPFERLRGEHAEVEGAGLGLSLSKRICELMGGTIGVESTLGKGSTFWVELPAAPGAARPAPAAKTRAETPAPPSPRASTRTIVYIEDNLPNLKLVQRIFARRPGFHLIPAIQGRLGLDLIRQHAPDLILLDLHLPDMRGEEVLAEIRRAPATATVPVIMITADAVPGESARLLALGASAYITKPFNIPEFLALLDNLLGKTAPGSEQK